MLGIKHRPQQQASNLGSKDSNKQSQQLGLKHGYKIDMSRLNYGHTNKQEGFDHPNLWAEEPKYEYAQSFKKKPYMVEKSGTRGQWRR